MFGSTAPAFGASGPAFGTSSSAGVAPLFGAGGFGSSATQPASQTGSLFGATSSTASALGSTGFSLQRPATTASIVSGAPAQQQLQATSSGFNSDQFTRILASITNPQICGDERDLVICRLNQLQAFSGAGKGYYYSGMPALDYSLENPFCRFKTVAYNRRIEFQNEDGYASLVIKKTAEEVEKFVQLLIDGLFKALGNKAQLSVQVNSIRPLPDAKCEVVIYVTETGPSGLKRKMLAADLANYLSMPNVRSLIALELAVESVTAKMDLTADQLKQYLDVPPSGIDPAIWMQAILDNPDPAKFIPVPVVGFGTLQERRKQQLQQAELHQNLTTTIDDLVSNLDYRVSQNNIRIQQYRANQNQLSHRLLRVLTRQQLLLRRGFALDAADEVLKSRLEDCLVKLNSPMQCKGRLTELISQIRTQPHLFATKGLKDARLTLDLDTVDELRLYLKRSQEALESLVTLIQQDSKNLKIVQEQQGIV